MSKSYSRYTLAREARAFRYLPVLTTDSQGNLYRDGVLVAPSVSPAAEPADVASLKEPLLVGGAGVAVAAG